MKLFAVTFLLNIIVLHVSAQKLHLNVYGGLSNYKGDLQNKPLSFTQARYSIGGGISYDLTRNIAVRAGLTYAKVTSDDKLNTHLEYRNLNFSSDITEGHIAFEYYLKDLNTFAITPYLFGGLAVFHFNPYTHDPSGTKVYLRPLSTEGEGFLSGKHNYNLTQLCIPFGGGFKYAVTENLNVGLELGFRKLFTDYLDDVSTSYVDQSQLLANRGQEAVTLAYRGGELKNGASYPDAGGKRGDPKFTDWYYFTVFTASFRLSTDEHAKKHDPYCMAMRCPRR